MRSEAMSGSGRSTAPRARRSASPAANPSATSRAHTNFCEYEDKELPDEQNRTRLARDSELEACASPVQTAGTTAGAVGGALIGGPVGAVVGGAAGAVATAPGAPLGGQYHYRCYSYDYNGNRHYHRCRAGEKQRVGVAFAFRSG